MQRSSSNFNPPSISSLYIFNFLSATILQKRAYISAYVSSSQMPWVNDSSSLQWTHMLVGSSNKMLSEPSGLAFILKQMESWQCMYSGYGNMRTSFLSTKISRIKILSLERPPLIIIDTTIDGAPLFIMVNIFFQFCCFSSTCIIHFCYCGISIALRIKSRPCRKFSKFSFCRPLYGERRMSINNVSKI